MISAYTLLLSFLPLMLVVGAWLLSVKRIERTRSLALGLQRHWKGQVLELEALIQERVIEAEARVQTELADDCAKVKADCEETLQAERAILQKEREALAKEREALAYEWENARAMFKKGNNFLAPWTWTEVERGDRLTGNHRLVLMHIDQACNLAKGWNEAHDVQVHFRARPFSALDGPYILGGWVVFLRGDVAAIDQWAKDAKDSILIEHNKNISNQWDENWSFFCVFRVRSKSPRW